MKITCTQKDLARGIAIANRAVSPRSTLPILGNVMLTAQGDELRIAGANMQMRIDCTVPCVVAEPGTITVPARLFVDMIAKLPSGDVALEVNHRTKSIQVRCGGYAAKINGLDSDSFPQMATDAELLSITVGADALCRMIDQTAFAASSDPSRFILAGVEVVFSRHLMTTAATDSYRLGVRSVQIDAPVEDACTFIVPATTLVELTNALSAMGSKADVGIKVYRNLRIGFFVKGGDSVTSLVLVSQLVDGKYPDYRAIIPPRFKTTATLETKALIRSLQMARILLRGDLDRVDLILSTDSVTVSIVNAEVGESGDELAATVTGTPMMVTLSSSYLLDVLNRIDGPSVVICLNDTHKPAVVRPVDMEPAQFTHVIMPITKGG